jgi:hypothetical protein
MLRSLLSVLCLAGLSACTAGVPSKAEVTASLQNVTAAVIAAPDPTAIAIEDAQRFPAKWEWRALHAGRAYTCNADNRLRLPDCVAIS